MSLDILLSHHIKGEKELGGHGMEQCYYVALETHTGNERNHDSLLLELNAHGIGMDLKVHNMVEGLRFHGKFWVLFVHSREPEWRIQSK